MSKKQPVESPQTESCMRTDFHFRRRRQFEWIVAGARADFKPTKPLAQPSWTSENVDDSYSALITVTNCGQDWTLRYG